MNKNEMINFIKENYYDIEASQLPKQIGVIPQQERLLNRRQKDDFIKKAKGLYGEKFADFLEVSMAMGSVPLGKKRKARIFWIDFDSWDGMYCVWKMYESGPVDATVD